MCLTEVATCLAWQLSQPHLVHLVRVAAQGTESGSNEIRSLLMYTARCAVLCGMSAHSVLERLHVCVGVHGGEWGGSVCMCVGVCMHACVYMHGCGQ